MGCGRVGSSLARNLERIGHSVAIIDQNPAAFRRLGPEFAGDQVTGVGFDRETLRRGRHRPGRRVRGSVAAATTRTSSRPGWPARRSASRTSSPASTTRKRAEVYERLGIPTVATVPWTAEPVPRHVLLGDKHVELWRDPTGAVSLVRGPAARGLDRPKVRALEEATDARVAFLTRFGRGMLPTPLDRAAGRRPGASCWSPTTIADDVAQITGGAAADGGALMRVAIAGAGNVGRSIARELIEQRPRRAAHRARPGEGRPGACRRRSGCWPTPASWPRCEEARLAGCDVVVVGHRRRQGQPGRVAAGQDRVRGAAGWWPGSTAPRTSGCSHEAVGRRRLGVHAAGDGRAGRGGGQRSATWCG